jgi:PBP1b-binding outer membrane lipoprotein LpoB
MRSYILILGAAVLLAACGSSDYVDPPASPPAPTDPPVAGTMVPTSATTSIAGATTFVRTTSAAMSDSDEPLIVGDAVLASSDSAEPAE